MGTLAEVKRGDTGAPYRVRFNYRDSALDLTGQVTLTTTVVFIMTPIDGTIPTVNRGPAVVESVDTAAKTVTVRYQWVTNDVATVGTYKGEFEFALTGGPASAPTGGYLIIRILSDLG